MIIRLLKSYDRTDRITLRHTGNKNVEGFENLLKINENGSEYTKHA